MKSLPLNIQVVKNNYIVLNNLYKQGKFEDRVETTENSQDISKFHYFPTDKLELKQKFASSANELRGSERNPQDLQWATRNLREQAQFLFEHYYSFSDENIVTVILCYYRIISLSYEVNDYFLDVSDDTSDFLIGLTDEITVDIKTYVAQFKSFFPEGSENYLELTKQILIVVLCGVNEFYRKHRYDDGLEKTKIVKQFIADHSIKFDELKERWHGLRGLCSFIMGKIYTSTSKFAEAETEFNSSVEAYSKSIWQKEQMFSKEQAKTSKAGKKLHKESEHKREHEISRSVALRRIGLVTSFGNAFQSLVLGKVKDAIYLSSVARGIVNWNTGKIWSAYVDLIYFSAKRAENSSNIAILLEIKNNLSRCFEIFVNLIPDGHYKNRALFQIALVNHYMARWHKEKGQDLDKSGKKEQALNEFKRAEDYWNEASENLSTTIDDDKLKLNKRLRAESAAILGHTLSNLGLLAGIFQNDGTGKFREAEEILEKAWEESAEYSQIQCEVGLAKAAVSKAYIEYFQNDFSNSKNLLGSTRFAERIWSKEEVEKINEAYKNSFQVLHEVLFLNNNSSIRIQATAFLRLAEVALMRELTRNQAYEYFDQYKKISSQVEHEFCHRWAHELEGKILESFTFTIKPGVTFNKEELEDKKNQYFVDYAVYHAAIEIEKDFFEGKINKSSSISSYLRRELERHCNLDSKAIENLYSEHKIFEKVRQISPHAKDLKEKLKTGKREKNKK